MRLLEAFIMKRILILGVLVLSLVGCGVKLERTIQDFTHPMYKKVRDISELTELILEKIDENDKDVALHNGHLVDKELGIPMYEVVSYKEIKHFNEEDIEDGLIVRSVVDDNPHLLILIEAKGKQEASNVEKSFSKVLSDQKERFHGKGISKNYMVNTNKRIRQGNYLIYVTWNNPKEAINVFERHIR